MNKSEFRTLTDSRIVILDGPFGSYLQRRGMPSGVCPEQWMTDNPDIIINLQRE